jgi:1,4-dihydroxy-6-naphthoate synthase
VDLRVACSPDADDLFMMRALAEGKLDTGPYTFHIETAPTDRLNALGEGDDPPHVLAFSIGYYPRLAPRYQLLPHGGSLGEGYGPVLVSKSPGGLADWRGARVAIPGRSTTAWLVLQLALPGVVPVEIPIVPHERVFQALAADEVDAALLIHEGRLTYARRGLHALLDLGVWWAEQTGGLPLPLGGNGIRRDLGAHIAPVSHLLRRSIQWARAQHADTVDWLKAQGSALHETADLNTYLAMYANDRTLDYGPEGRRAIALLLERGAQAGLVPAVGEVDFAP